MSATSLSRRLPTQGPDDEFRRLKTAFNGMLDRLESAFEARQRFAADASHELRTPLAVMGAMADNVLDGGGRAPRAARDLADEVREQVDRSESLVDSLLTLARADDVRKTRTRVDLADVAADAVSTIADAAAGDGGRDRPRARRRARRGRLRSSSRGWSRTRSTTPSKYNLAEGGTIECSTRSSTGEIACLRVANTGPAVAEKEIPRLFERFERGATRSEANGHGLGLPIIRRVAEAHGGSAGASPRPGRRVSSSWSGFPAPSRASSAPAATGAREGDKTPVVTLVPRRQGRHALA